MEKVGYPTFDYFIHPTFKTEQSSTTITDEKVACK